MSEEALAKGVLIGRDSMACDMLEFAVPKQQLPRDIGLDLIGSALLSAFSKSQTSSDIRCL